MSKKLTLKNVKSDTKSLSQSQINYSSKRDWKSLVASISISQKPAIQTEDDKSITHSFVNRYFEKQKPKNYRFRVMNPPPFDENKKAVRDFPNHFEKQERFITSEDPLGIYAKSFIFEAHPKRLIPPTSIDLN